VVAVRGQLRVDDQRLARRRLEVVLEGREDVGGVGSEAGAQGRLGAVRLALVPVDGRDGTAFGVVVAGVGLRRHGAFARRQQTAVGGAADQGVAIGAGQVGRTDVPTGAGVGPGGARGEAAGAPAGRDQVDVPVGSRDAGVRVAAVE